MNQDLPNDIIDYIMKIRTEEMRKDKEIKDNKINFKKVMDQIKGSFYFELGGKFYFNLKNTENLDSNFYYRNLIAEQNIEEDFEFSHIAEEEEIEEFMSYNNIY